MDRYELIANIEKRYDKHIEDMSKHKNDLLFLASFYSAKELIDLMLSLELIDTNEYRHKRRELSSYFIQYSNKVRVDSMQIKMMGVGGRG